MGNISPYKHGPPGRCVRVRLALGALSNKHFDNALFPLRTPHEEYLPRYAERMDALELDIMRGRRDIPEDVARWVEQAPDGFVFCPKLAKHATDPHHLETPQPWTDEALDAARDSLALFEPIADAGKLGPVVAQFPPRFAPTVENRAWLDELLDLEPAGTFVVEFRDPDWFTDDVKSFLGERRTQLVWSTHEKAPAPAWVTGPMGYVRLAGKYHKSAATRNRPVHRAQRTEDLLRIRDMVAQAPWPQCIVAVLNPFEGNALDSLPQVAAALEGPERARQFARKPGDPLLKEPPGRPKQAGLPF